MNARPKYFVLIVEGGTLIECRGPYDTLKEQDRGVRVARMDTDPETDGVFTLSIAADGWPTVSACAASRR